MKKIIILGFLAAGLLIKPETYASNPVVHLKVYKSQILGVLIQENQGNVKLKISDSKGEILYKENSIVSSTYGKGFDFKRLNNGHYTVQLFYGKFTETHQFLIKNGKIELI